MTADPQLILANAVSLWLGGGSTDLPWVPAGATISSPPNAGGDHVLATAAAQLAVTGRNAWTAFNGWNPQDAQLVTEYGNRFGSPFPAADIQDAATEVLDAAYKALWAIRSNDPAWRSQRTTLGWIAVSGFEDTPHRPVNVPTAPYPQYDLKVTVPGHPETTTRFMVASAGAWIGPSMGGPSHSALLMFSYQRGALYGSAANAATSRRGRWISISVRTSTDIVHQLSRSGRAPTA
jgi:hypothetical protein